MSYRLAILGVTGKVGQETINILLERHFPIASIRGFASRDSLGREISLGDYDILKVEALDTLNFDEFDLVFSCLNSEVTKKILPKKPKPKCTIIDYSSAYRMAQEVPLIVPEINGALLGGDQSPRLIANPNCVAAIVATVLGPLHKEVPIKRIVMATYQSTSGAGSRAMDELHDQTKGIFTNQAISYQQFPKQIAFNAIPHIDAFLNNGFTGEEQKIQQELQKIIDPSLAITVTCVRIPTFIGHAAAVYVECADAITVGSARQILRSAPGVTLLDTAKPGGYATPIDVAGEDAVYVSRLRQDPSIAHGLCLWVAGDNIRKGAALNAVQIAEQLCDLGSDN